MNGCESLPSTGQYYGSATGSAPPWAEPVGKCPRGIVAKWQVLVAELDRLQTPKSVPSWTKLQLTIASQTWTFSTES